jgi:hypothetical protein
MKPMIPPLALALALAMSPARADPRADVQAALRNAVATGWFHARTWGRIFGPDLPALAGEVAAVLPDRIRVRSSGLEFIALPDAAWTNAFGTWVATDRAMLPVTSFDPAEMGRAIDAIRDVRREGHAVMDACTADVYRFRASGQLPGAVADGDIRLWVCRDDRRPARLEADDGAGGRITVLFDWSRPVEVRAPG